MKVSKTTKAMFKIYQRAYGPDTAAMLIQQFSFESNLKIAALSAFLHKDNSKNAKFLRKSILDYTNKKTEDRIAEEEMPKIINALDVDFARQMYQELGGALKGKNDESAIS